MGSWQKQTPDKPLFPDLLWSRPENKSRAGKLLIIGGQAGEFMNVSSAYSFANEAGAGAIKLLLPQSLQKIAKNIEGTEFAPSNSSGSFAKNALADFFEISEWAEHVLLAGDFGKNSETTVILDGYLLKSPKPITINQNSLESIGNKLEQLVNMPLTLVISREAFRKIGIAVGTHVPITSLTTYDQIGEIIQNISGLTKANFVIADENNIWCASSGDITSTRSNPVDLNALSAYCAIWQMQNPDKPLEALTTAAFEILK